MNCLLSNQKMIYNDMFTPCKITHTTLMNQTFQI